ncbi:MAG: hypothetical protein WAL34_04305 [Acidobacteriaceae bacterium]
MQEDGDNLERLYTPQELARLFHFDESTIRRLFIDEPGVLVFGKADRRDGKRQYVSLRVPESVVRRVYGRQVRKKPPASVSVPPERLRNVR